MEKWKNKLKKSLGIEETKTFQGAGRKLGTSATTSSQHKVDPSRLEARRLQEGSTNDAVKPSVMKTTSSGPKTQTAGQRDDARVPAPRPQLVISSSAEHPDVAQALRLLFDQDVTNDLRCLSTIHKILLNLVSKPEDLKVRKLRLGNAKVQEHIINAQGGMELLLACGFSVSFSNEEDGKEEGYLVFPDGTELVRVQAALDDISRSMHGPGSSRVDANSPLPPAGGRNTILEIPVHVDVNLPDWFFEQSSAEIRSLYQENKLKQEESKILMTRAMREKLARKNALDSQPSVLSIRIRSPEGTKIRGDFNPGEPIQALFAWVADCLEDPMQEFDLVLPDRSKLGAVRFEDKTIKSSGLSSSVTLNLAWQGMSVAHMKNKKTFREDLQ